MWNIYNWISIFADSNSNKFERWKIKLYTLTNNNLLYYLSFDWWINELYNTIFENDTAYSNNEYTCFYNYQKLENILWVQIKSIDKQLLKKLFREDFKKWNEIIYKAYTSSNKDKTYYNKNDLNDIINWLCYKNDEIKKMSDNKNYNIVTNVETALVRLKEISVKWWKINYYNNSALYW